MNKIIIDKEKDIELKDNVVELDIKVSELTLNIKGKVLINEITSIEQEHLNLILNIHENSSLLYNRFTKVKNIQNKITINQNNNSEAIFNYSILVQDEGNIKLKSNLYGNNNITEINIASATEDNGSLKIMCTSDAKEKITNNNLIEKINILLLNDTENVIIPDLLVASNEVEINHAATIGGIKPDELFYLTSKGLSEEKAQHLIKNGFLINNLDLSTDHTDRIKELIGR